MKAFNSSDKQLEYLTQAIENITQTFLNIKDPDHSKLYAGMIQYLEHLENHNVIQDFIDLDISEQLFGVYITAEVKIKRWHTISIFVNY